MSLNVVGFFSNRIKQAFGSFSGISFSVMGQRDKGTPSNIFLPNWGNGYYEIKLFVSLIRSHKYDMTHGSQVFWCGITGNQWSTMPPILTKKIHFIPPRYLRSYISHGQSFIVLADEALQEQVLLVPPSAATPDKLAPDDISPAKHPLRTKNMPKRSRYLHNSSVMAFSGDSTCSRS
ncbi:hypothetical protein JCM33374_g6617 [Metschnikowia sp. JCM 33374]|nr:hypothetical protein JCM33374_g6617 [Metschnikowia sp. JCM 33374]